MLDIAYAQRAPGVGGPGPVMTLIPFVLIFIIMYFMVIRPQQKKNKEHQELLNKLKKNDEVMTSGGIYGKILALAVLALGELSHSKGAVPVAFLVGGPMTLGGLAVGLVRSIPRRGRRS